MHTNRFHRFLITIVGGALVCAVPVAAQQSAPTDAPNATAQQTKSRDNVAMRLERMSQHLNLTEDQKTKLTPILQNDAQQARAIRQDTSLAPDQRRAKMQELRQSTRSQVESILTPEQRAQMANFAQRGKGMGAKRMGMGQGMGMDPARHINQLSKQLNLSDEQKSKLQPLFEEQQKQMQALRQDTSLTPEQKRAKVKELRQANHQKVMAVLTPEQQQKLQQIRANRPHNRRGYGQGMGPDMQPAPPSPPKM